MPSASVQRDLSGLRRGDFPGKQFENKGLFSPVTCCVVPVPDLQANEYAGYDKQRFDRYGTSVLLAEGVCEAAQDHAPTSACGSCFHALPFIIPHARELGAKSQPI